MGVKAQLGQRQVLLGRRRWLEEQDVDMSPIAGDEYIEPEGISVLYAASDGKCIGWVGLEDRTRPEARAAIDQLRQLGIKHLTMVTGDRWSVARRVAAEMGCSRVQAEVLPQDKLTLVDELKHSGYSVAVIGDGINDAPALAAGDLGVAMGAAGSDVAINSASIALMNNDLERLPFLIRLSRATVRVIRQNLGFGVLIIVTMILLASIQAIGPITAVILHTIGSAVVIFNSARLVRFGEQPQGVETALPAISTAAAST